jgi:hypothetical protein
VALSTHTSRVTVALVDRDFVAVAAVILTGVADFFDVVVPLLSSLFRKSLYRVIAVSDSK